MTKKEWDKISPPPQELLNRWYKHKSNKEKTIEELEGSEERSDLAELQKDNELDR